MYCKIKYRVRYIFDIDEGMNCVTKFLFFFFFIMNIKNFTSVIKCNNNCDYILSD